MAKKQGISWNLASPTKKIFQRVVLQNSFSEAFRILVYRYIGPIFKRRQFNETTILLDCLGGAFHNFDMYIGPF